MRQHMMADRRGMHKLARSVQLHTMYTNSETNDAAPDSLVQRRAM